MKMRHKRTIKRIVAGVLALLFAYAATFGSWLVFPAAAILYYAISKVEIKDKKKKNR